jgi:hypothetical protein
MNNKDHNNTAGLCGASLDLTLHATHAHPNPVAGPRRASRACKKRLPPLARTYRTIMLYDAAKAHTPFSLIVFFRLAGLTLWMCA